MYLELVAREMESPCNLRVSRDGIYDATWWGSTKEITRYMKSRRIGITASSSGKGIFYLSLKNIINMKYLWKFYFE